MITKGTVVVWDGERTSLHSGKKDELGSKSKLPKKILKRLTSPDPEDL
jgi:hypothetical protein